jgi:hypothetical protein
VEFQKVPASHQAMVGGGMMLGEVISKVIGALTPVHTEVSLGDSVFEPVETHINGLRVTLFDSVIENTCSTCIVSLYGSGRLGMSHVDKGIT